MSSERYWRRERPGMPVYGPTDPFGDEEHEPDVIVRVDFLMSREQLTTALGIAWAEIAGNRSAESLTVPEVRHEVEAWLSVQAFHELDKQMERDQARTWPPEQQAVMRVLAEAVDRAYPPRSEPETPPVQQPRYGKGTVTLATLDHGLVEVEEPEWCVGHPGQPVGHRADITHNGRPVVAEVETARGTEQLLEARLSWAPFAELAPEPDPVVDLADLPPMTGAELREVATELSLFAGRLYRLSNQVDQLRGHRP